MKSHATSTRSIRRSWAALLALGALVVASPAGAAGRPVCCRVAAGTAVQVALVDQVSTETQKQGDTFALRLAAPLIVDGRVVLRAGTPGVGEVIQSSGPGIGGKSAKLVLAASSLTTRHGRVALDALKLARPGRDNSTAAEVLSVSGIAYAPLGIVGIVLPGGAVVFKPGTIATAKVSADVVLPPLGRASRAELAAAAASAADGAAADDAGPIAIPAPPAGLGQVVFFRSRSLLGTAQWFNVREDGRALGRLGNGAYFVQPESPGVHTYTAKLEPELKDHLKLQVDAGETYFVEGTLTGGLVITAADLSPSTHEKFNRAKHLKLASAPADDTGPTTGAAPAGDTPPQ